MTLQRKRQAEACEQSLIEFLKGGWRYIDPQPYSHGWHLEAVAEHLEAVTRGTLKRLIINVPPRTSKSSLVSVTWPIWTWAQRKIGPLSGPQVQFLFASYAQSLALRDSVKSRRLVESPFFQKNWGDKFVLTGDQNTKIRFENDKGGYRLATSVGGALTGEGAQIVVCVPFNTVLQTPDGPRKIGEIVNSRASVPVLGYNHQTEQPAWQTIELHERNPTREIVEVRADNGFVLRCTADHPVYVEGRGYVQAQALNAGDKLTCWSAVSDMREAVQAKILDVQPEVRVHIAGPREDSRQHQAVHSLRQDVLQSTCSSGKNWRFADVQFKMPRRSDVWRGQPILYRKSLPKTVQGVWKGIYAIGGASKILFLRVQHKVSVAHQSRSISQDTAKGMRQVRDHLHAIHSGDEVLFGGLQRRLPFRSHARRWERSLCARGAQQAIWSWLDATAQTARKAARRLQMSRVSHDRGTARVSAECAPHRLQQEQHGNAQPNQLLQILPRQDARESGKSGRVASAVVVSVERVAIEPVFNVRVGPDHNYFANGILVHNCDDPHNANEVESELIRENTLQWWDEALSTRLNDPKTGAFVVIMQRLHERDLTGHILAKQHKDWEHLMLPMRYEPARACSTSLGFRDPRSIDGELLCPDRFDEPTLKDLEGRLGPYAVAGQLQQRPEVRGGAIFQREWWQTWEGRWPRPNFTIAALDSAYTEKQENDPSALTVWRCYTDEEGRPKIVLCAAWEKRLQLNGKTIERLPGETDAEYRQRASKDWGLVDWVADTCNELQVDRLLIEGKASGISVAQEIKRLHAAKTWAVVMVDPKGRDKVARAHAITSLFVDGMIYAPKREWAQAVIDQAAAFPKAAHDDLVDSMLYCLDHLRTIGLAIRSEEHERELQELMKPPTKNEPVYEV